MGEVYKARDTRLERMVAVKVLPSERNPNFGGLHRILGDAYATKKMTREAIAEYQAMAALGGSNTLWGPVALTRAQALAGRRSEALRTIEEMKTLATSRYVSPAFIAMGFQILGDKDLALNWWAKACEDHSVDVRYLKVDPMNDNLRDDPRFADLLRKARLGP